MNTTSTKRRTSVRIEGAMVQEMARLVTQTTLSYREISERLGVASSTVRRRAEKDGWKRPTQDNSTTMAAACDPELRRRGFAERMWRIAESQLGQLEAEQSVRTQGIATREMIGLVQAVDKLSSLANRDSARARKPAADVAGADADYAGIQPVQGIAPQHFIFQNNMRPARDLETLADHLDQNLRGILAERGGIVQTPDTDTPAPTITVLRDLAGIAGIWQARQSRAGG